LNFEKKTPTKKSQLPAKTQQFEKFENYSHFINLKCMKNSNLITEIFLFIDQSVEKIIKSSNELEKEQDLETIKDLIGKLKN
jgi:hypothetical protein